MFNVATRWKLFEGENPASKVPKRDVQRRQTQYLEAHEIPVLLDAVPERWRGVFAVGIYAGLRKGEIAGLRWTDIDLGRRVITVARSYNRPTKTKRIRQVEICDELLAFLEEEHAKRRSELVFPMTNGSMMPEHQDLCRVFENARERADIVIGYDHVCRRRGCGYKERPRPRTSRAARSAPCACASSRCRSPSASTTPAARSGPT